MRKFNLVAPEMIHKHVKTVQDARKNLYYTAPEYGSASWGVAIDIYAFGVCALEMAMTELLTTVVNGVEGKPKLPDHEAILAVIERLEDQSQRVKGMFIFEFEFLNFILVLNFKI